MVEFLHLVLYNLYERLWVSPQLINHLNYIYTKIVAHVLRELQKFQWRGYRLQWQHVLFLFRIVGRF